MPRFVRPAWIAVSADGTSTPRGIGPRTIGGWLSASLTLRTADGTVSPAIEIRAGGNYADGTGRASIEILRGFACEIIGADGSCTVYSADAIRGIEIRPIA
jgi:hypothetical protein